MHAVPRLWSKEKAKFKKVFQLLQHVWIIANETKLSGVGKAESMMNATCHNLSRIETRLKHGNVRVGIIGLTKAGKSTFLNALLGGRFLPSSVLPETADETVIIHDMSKLDGELHCTAGEKSSVLAKGRKEIYRELLELNQKTRNKDEAEKNCDKLILYAPLQFLVATDIQDIQLELSDTPGFGEAGVKNIADSTNIVVREMCAFIWILNSNNLKTVSEKALLRDLQLHHSEIFSKLNRVLILVNVHTNLYAESWLSSNDTDKLSSNAITPEKLPEYISNYFANPDILGQKISPEKIKLFHALWALRSREWNKTMVIDPNVKKATMLYREAMLMLRYFHEENAADNYENDMNDKNIIKSTVELLQKRSNIEEVENIFKRMVIDNGGLVLLASAAYDTISILTNSFEPVLKTLIENEHIDTRKEEMQSAEKLDNLFQNVFSQIDVAFNDMSSSIASSTQAHVSTLQATVRESLLNVISSKVTENQNFQVEDKTEVANRMQIARDAIPITALVKIKNSWINVTDAIKKCADSQLDSTFSNIRFNILSSLATLKGGAGSSDYTFHDFVEGISTSVSTTLMSASDNAGDLVPASTSLAIDEFTLSKNKAIQNIAIDSYILKGTKQKIKSTSRRTCHSSGWFGWGETCDDVNESFPYDISVFSTNINAFKTAFDETISDWVGLYNKLVEDYLHKISSSTRDAGKNKLINILQGSQQGVTGLLHSRQKVLKTTEQNVSFLKEKQDEIDNVKKKLENST